MMWTESDFRTAAHVCTIIGLIGVALRVFFYFVSSRPNETYSSFHTRVEFGEFRWERLKRRSLRYIQGSSERKIGSAPAVVATPASQKR